MAGKRYILCLEDSRYELDGRSLRDVTGVRDLDGDGVVFSDFEGAALQVATVESGGKYAHAVLEKELRETGDIEPGGRLLVLLKRRRGQRTTELLYIAAPGDAAMEKEIERDFGDNDYLLFPVQKLLANILTSFKPRRPTAFMLIGERHVDVLVADRRVLYGAFRMSALTSGGNRELLERNLETALRGIEKEYNIQLEALHGEYLLAPSNADHGWIGAVAEARGIPCGYSPATVVDKGDERYITSVLGRLRRMRASESCSPLPVINNYRANEALPWVAAAMVTCCAVALYLLIDRHGDVARVQSRISELSASLDSKLAHAPPSVPSYRPYLETAARIDYARSIPTLRQVLGHVSEAARLNATTLSVVEAEYKEDLVVVTLTGQSQKGRGADSMAHYNRFVTELRRLGYALAESELDTDTRLIDFTSRLERLVDGKRT